MGGPYIKPLRIASRLWVCWNPTDLNVTLISQNDQVIRYGVSRIDNILKMVISIVYGDNFPTKREALWTDIVYHVSVFNGRPLVLNGDFNATRNQSERAGCQMIG